MAKLRRIVFASCVLLAELVVYIGVYAAFITMTVRSIGDADRDIAESFIIDWVVGAGLIATGNALLGYTVQWMTSYIGFKWQDRMLTCQLLIIVPVVLINCIADLFMARVEAFETVNIFRRAGMSSQGVWRLWRSSTGHMELMPCSVVNAYNDLVEALVPTYVLIPYIFEPIFTLFVFRWLAIERTRRDARVTPELAERILLASDVDIVLPPYCDFITCTTTIIYHFWRSPGPSHKILFPALLLFAVVLFSQCSVRILRWHTYTYFGSKNLHDTEMMLWALPLGMLAASIEYNSITGLRTGALGTQYFTAHCIAHIMFVLYVVPTLAPNRVSSVASFKEADERSRRSSSFANYLNINPIEILKYEEQQANGGCRLEGGGFEPGARPAANRDPGGRGAGAEPLVFYSPSAAHLQPGAGHDFDMEDAFVHNTGCILAYDPVDEDDGDDDDDTESSRD